MVDVVHSEIDIGHRVGKIEGVGAGFAVIVCIKLKRAIGVDRFRPAVDPRDILGVGLIGLFNAVIRDGRKGDIDGAGVLGLGAVNA